jgi:hypothetical protein
MDDKTAQHEEERHAEMADCIGILQNRNFRRDQETANGVSPEHKSGRIEAQPRQAWDFWPLHPRPLRFIPGGQVISSSEGNRETL